MLAALTNFFPWLFSHHLFQSAILYDLWKLWLVKTVTSENYRASFLYLPSYTLTYCMAGQLWIVNGIRHKELRRKIGGRSSPFEQTPQPKLVPRKKCWKLETLTSFSKWTGRQELEPRSSHWASIVAVSLFHWVKVVLNDWNKRDRNWWHL